LPVNTDSDTSPSRGLPGGVGRTLLICALLVAAAAAAVVLIFSTEPEPQRETAVRQTAMLVDVTPAEAGTFRPVIQAMGSVRPAREIMLQPRVSGQVTGIAEDFTPGGYVAQGDVLVRIEQADYRNALQQRESELAQARADLAMQEGQAAKAKQDFEELGRELPPEREALVLREPQLDSARASVQSAEAAVEQARLDLGRATITAPFDAHVLTRQVNQGSQVDVGTALGRLVGIDTYWVEATVPVDKLRWLEFADGAPEAGSPVQIRNRTAWPEGVTRQGYLYKLVGELSGETRLARVLVAVDDPLALNETDGGGDFVPPLMIGAFVETRIQGAPLDNVVRINRDHLRKDDTVWLMEDGKLAIRPVDVVLRDAQYVYVREGLSGGEQVVTSSLATVEEGVSLRTGEASNEQAGQTGTEAPAAGGAPEP
jgi:RND family efflux transporter MFP subunit